MVLVVGSVNSSNSNRLRELAERCGAHAYLVDDARALQKSWFDNARSIGVTAGASAPEVLVQGVVDRLRALGATDPSEIEGEPENVRFSLPIELRPERQA